ncbi:MAG: cytochrome c [Candidatus Tectomicrobia bacterium]|nr:cytochrome c [Candidatus Tectomicrobia bacterium]
MRQAAVWGVLVLLGFGAAVYLSRRDPPPGLKAAARETAGDSTPAALTQGEALFERNCMACHGPEGGGSRQGPPLVHRIYAPGHHADEAFLLAVRRGVRAHHWRFGDMPPVPAVSPDEVKLVIAYVRGLQKKAGIF